jgi:hypothetical protein
MKGVAAAACGILAIAAARSGAARPDLELLVAGRGLPTAFTSQLLDPVGCAETGTGELLVLDRRMHVVWAVDAKRATWRKVVLSGQKLGQIERPSALALGPGDQFVVADSSQGADRLQWFDLSGKMAGAFWLPDKHQPPIILQSVVFNGIGALHFARDSFYVGYPFRGSLISEVDLKGLTVRQIGLQRPTGQESDPELHLALNFGAVAADPTGGFYYIFQTGEPLFRRYDADGHLVFERHIEGVEIDEKTRALPNVWPRPADREGNKPFVEPMVRAAAVDRTGRLWVSLQSGFTYVYDRRGDKIRTVQFDADGVVAPSSLFFTTDGRLLVAPGCYEFSVKEPPLP